MRFFLSDIQTFLFHQKLYGMSFSLSPLSGEAPGCIFYRIPMCSLSVVRNLNNKHTPSDILLLMFILHTFMGALSKSKMCWSGLRRPGNHPIIIIIIIALKSPPWPCKVSHLYFYLGQSFTKYPSWRRENIWSQNCWCRTDTPLVVDWNPFRIHNYVWFMFLITDPGIDGPGFM